LHQKNIGEIRLRLAFHVSATTLYLDSLAGGALATIEGTTSQTRDALARIEGILTDLVKEVKGGSRDSSVLSDNANHPWNVWRELKQDLELSGFSPSIVEQFRTEIKSYLLGLVEIAGIEDDLAISERDGDRLSVNEDMDGEGADNDQRHNPDIVAEPNVREDGNNLSIDFEEPSPERDMFDLNTYIDNYFLNVFANSTRLLKTVEEGKLNT